MHFKDYWYVAWNVITPIFVSAILVSIPLIFIFKLHAKKEELFSNAIFIVAFALFGGVIGFCVGASRESAVGAVLPAILTVLATLSGFAFTSEGLKDHRPLIPYVLLALILMSVHWVVVGSKYRFIYDRWVEINQERLLRFEKIDLELERARRFKEAGFPLPTAESAKASVLAGELKSELPTASKSGTESSQKGDEKEHQPSPK